MKEIIKSYKTELKPNKRQREYLTGACGASRFVYNWGLDQAIKHYKKTKKYIGKRSECCKKSSEISF